MIHTFYSLGNYIVIDVGSGAIHVVDKLAHDVLKLWDKTEDSNILFDKLSGNYSLEEVKQVVEEIQTLEDMGQLYSDANYKDIKIESSNVVKAMCLHVAHDCNLRCKYCFAGEGDYNSADKELMSYNVGKKAIDWLVKASKDRKNLEIDFFGGEPLLNMSVVKKLVSYGRSIEKKYNKTFKFTMTTNCVALNDENIKFLNEHMDNIVLSVDGRKFVHDKMRVSPGGKGSYEIIIEKAKKLVEARGQGEYYIRGTFTRNNLDFSKDVFHLVDEGFEQISIEPVVAEAHLDYALKKEDIPKIKQEYDILLSKYYSSRKGGKWFNFFHFMLDISAGPCLRKRLMGCGVGNEYVAVSPNGDIYPCHQFVNRDKYLMGNVLENNFDTEVQNYFAKNNVINKPKCQDCWAKFYCSGGCAANAEDFNGDIFTPEELSCELERKRLECAIALNVKEKLDRNRG